MKFLRKGLAPLLTLLLMVGAVAAQEKATGQPAGSPKLVIESFTKDFGDVLSGAPLKYSFKIKNEGTTDLLIQNVAPG
jgi:hypothetical protein